MTNGINKNTIDGISLKKIGILYKQLKQKKSVFKPIRRVYIPKPGKATKLPLAIQNFIDRLVLEGRRIILEAIYEPVFEELDFNFELRKNYLTHDAMHRRKN
jgi:retron-type reverse transcriptase